MVPQAATGDKWEHDVSNFNSEVRWYWGIMWRACKKVRVTR